MALILPRYRMAAGDKTALKILLGLLSGLLIATAAFVYVIDPCSVFDSPIINGVNQIKIYDPPQQDAVYRAVWKTVNIIRKKPDRIILGSSTADGGFEMSDPYYAKLQAEGGPIYNAAIRGANLETVDHYLRHAYVNNPRLKEVFLSLDWLFFSWQNPPCCRPALEPAILGKTYVPPTFLAEQLWSWYAVRDSFIVYDDSSRHRISHWLSRRSSSAQVWASRHFPSLVAPPESQTSYPPLLAARTSSEFQRFVLLEQFARQWSVRPHSDYLEEDAFQAFRRIVSFCDEHHIVLHVFLTPTEETWWAAAKRTGVWTAYLEFLRRIAAIHPFWDFGVPIDSNASKADLYFGGDLWHYQNAAGRIILTDILAGTARGAAEGLYVTPANVEEHIREIGAVLDNWISRNPYQARFVDHVPLDRDLNTSDLFPHLLDPDYRGFWIAQQADHFYAFPGTVRTLDIVAVKEHAVPGMLEGRSLGEVRTAIDQEADKRGGVHSTSHGSFHPAGRSALSP